MGTRKIFEDEHNGMMDCYLNDKGMVYINVRNQGEDFESGNSIVLDKSDVQELISMLTDFHLGMDE